MDRKRTAGFNITVPQTKEQIFDSVELPLRNLLNAGFMEVEDRRHQHVPGPIPVVILVCYIRQCRECIAGILT